MRLYLKISGYDIRFSNPAEGFQFSIEDPENEDIYMTLYFKPWEDLPNFVSAVMDYSWSNGLCEVEDEGLNKLKQSTKGLMDQIIKEIEYRKANNTYYGEMEEIWNS
jgi:hypothetical protein